MEWAGSGASHGACRSATGEDGAECSHGGLKPWGGLHVPKEARRTGGTQGGVSRGRVPSREVAEETREAPFLDSLKAALASCVVASLSIGVGSARSPPEKGSVEAGAASDLAPCRQPGW